jgi:hypothetical protein
MAKIHMVLQGKGGVGKSMVASVIAQYLTTPEGLPLCIDTDPVNATFTGYEALDVKRLNIMEGKKIDPRKFDTMIEMVAEENRDIVIDNGASTFVPLSNYLITNQVPALLQEMGHEIVVHTVITGGQALLDTISGFSQLLGQYPEECQFVAWLNPYWGPIEHEGKKFEQMKAYTTNKGRLTAIIEVPTLEDDARVDFSEMLQARRTFEEVLNSKEVSIMSRQRLKIAKRDLFAQMENAAVF